MTRLAVLVAAVTLLLAAAPGTALAACQSVPGNLVANCSFEQPALGAGSETRVDAGKPIGAWTVSAGGDAVDLVTAGFGGRYPVLDGSQSVDLNRDNPGAVEQRLPTSPGVRYRVTVELSGFVASKSGCSATEPERLRISVGGVRQDVSFRPDDTATPPGAQRFEQHAVDFIAGGNDLLKLAGLNAGCTGPIVDDVVVTGAPAQPAPVLGKRMTAQLVSGTALVKEPGSRGFVPLAVTTSLPIGTIVDARHGRVRITATSGGKTYFADFYAGEFVIAQRASRGATADLKLFGGSFKGCVRGARVAKRPKSVRQLWGSGSGPFRTIGRFGSATVRGTTWLTKDTCSGTLTVVRAGSVTVRDFVKRRNVIVRAGKSYFAQRRG